MRFTEEDILLRIFLSETARFKGISLYEHVVIKAKELKIAGATVLRGIMGFGADSHLHSSKLIDLGISLPVVIEMVDREENINKILPYLDEVVTDGFMTLEKVSVIRYRLKQ